MRIVILQYPLLILCLLAAVFVLSGCDGSDASESDGDQEVLDGDQVVTSNLECSDTSASQGPATW